VAPGHAGGLPSGGGGFAGLLALAGEPGLVGRARPERFLLAQRHLGDGSLLAGLLGGHELAAVRPGLRRYHFHFRRLLGLVRRKGIRQGAHRGPLSFRTSAAAYPHSLFGCPEGSRVSPVEPDTSLTRRDTVGGVGEGLDKAEGRQQYLLPGRPHIRSGCDISLPLGPQELACGAGIRDYPRPIYDSPARGRALDNGQPCRNGDDGPGCRELVVLHPLVLPPSPMDRAVAQRCTAAHRRRAWQVVAARHRQVVEADGPGAQ